MSVQIPAEYECFSQDHIIQCVQILQQRLYVCYINILCGPR